MTSIRNAILASACALGVAGASLPAEAASQPAQKTIAGVNYKDIMTVGHHGGGGGWGGGGGHFGGGRGGGGWGGGGRHFSGGGWNGGGGRHWGGGGGYYGHGGHYGYYGHHGGHGYGYAAAGLFGLAAGAALASPYYGGGYYDDDYYYGGGYPSRAYYERPYGGAECQVISRAHDRYGRPIRVVRYRPC